MKNIFNNIIIAILLLTTASCTNDFLNEGLNTPLIPAGESTIYLSPEWEAADYQFYLPDMGDADFKIESKPSWLRINTTDGKLNNSVATIHCSAKNNSAFEKVGVYLDKIEVSVGKQTFYVPIAYITEGNPIIQVEKTLAINDSFYLKVYNSGEGILIWDIVSLPDWLSIDTDRLGDMSVIVPPYSYGEIPLTFNLNADLNKDTTGTIVLKSNDRNNPTVEIEIVVDLGNPEIGIWGIYDNKIDFGATDTTHRLDIDAWGSGLLVWHFEELPEWLTATPSKGVYHTHTYYEDVMLTCDRSKLQPGVNSSVIYLKSNASNNPSIAIAVTAHAPGDNANIRELEGNVTDVAFDKKTNTLYYVTSHPNKLVVYDVTERVVLKELQLGNTPTCLAVSEDCTKVAVGHDGQISAVNLENWSVTNIGINGTLTDIAWSADDWFCYSTQGRSHRSLCWINTNTLATYESLDDNLYGDDIIKKVPAQPYVIATQKYISPSGFITYSTSTKRLKSYSHMTLSNFWFSEDGQYTFGRDKNVYKTSSATGSNNTFDTPVNSIGELRGEPDDYYHSTKWIEHSSASHCLWVISNDSEARIYQYEDNDFTFQKLFYYSDIYQPEGQAEAYEVEAEYLFSNKGGTELSVLRKGKYNDNWSVEFIKVTP